MHEDRPTAMKAMDTNSGKQRPSDREIESRAGLFALFMAHTPAAVAMCDLQMRYLAYSRRWAEDYGLGDENLLGRSITICFRICRRTGRMNTRGVLPAKQLKRRRSPFQGLTAPRTGSAGSCVPGGTAAAKLAA